MTQPPTISAQQRNQLKRTFRKDLKATVKLQLFTRFQSAIAIPGRDCPTCDQTQQLMEEVAGASPKIELAINDFFADPEVSRTNGVARIPAILLGDDVPPRLRFYGIPLGSQMAVIVETIRTLSRGVSPLSNDSRRKLLAINRPVHLQVVVTPEDQASAEAAYLAFAVANESSSITAEAIQIRDFPSIARNLGVQSVPLAIINDFYRLSPPVTENRLVEQVLTAGAPSTN